MRLTLLTEEGTHGTLHHAFSNANTSRDGTVGSLMPGKNILKTRTEGHGLLFTITFVFDYQVCNVVTHFVLFCFVVCYAEESCFFSVCLDDKENRGIGIGKLGTSSSVGDGIFTVKSATICVEYVESVISTMTAPSERAKPIVSKSKAQNSKAQSSKFEL